MSGRVSSLILLVHGKQPLDYKKVTLKVMKGFRLLNILKRFCGKI